MKKLLVLLFALGLVAAACGSDSEPAATAAPTTSAPSETAAPSEPAGTVAAGEPKLRGEPVPPLEFTYFETGETGSLDDFLGTPVILNFWASWCPACVAEMPDFEAVNAKFDGQVAFVGVDIQDQRELADRLAAETGVKYTLVEDPDGATYRAIGGFAMPTTLFINELGEVVKQQNGAMFAEELEANIRELLLNG